MSGSAMFASLDIYFCSGGGAARRACFRNYLFNSYAYLYTFSSVSAYKKCSESVASGCGKLRAFASLVCASVF